MEHFYTTHTSGYNIGPFDSEGRYIQPLDARFTDRFNQSELKYEQRNVEHSYTKVTGYPRTIGPPGEELTVDPVNTDITYGVRLGRRTETIALLDKISAGGAVGGSRDYPTIGYSFRHPGEYPTFVYVSLFLTKDRKEIKGWTSEVLHTVRNVRDVRIEGSGENRVMKCTFEYGTSHHFNVVEHKYPKGQYRSVASKDAIARTAYARADLKPTARLTTYRHIFRPRIVQLAHGKSASALVKEFNSQEKEPIDFRSWSALTLDASKKHHVIDSNYIESLAEIASIKGLFKSAIKRLKALPRSSKEVAGDYLAVKYGVLPLIDDIQQLLRAFSAPSLTMNSSSLYQMTATDTVAEPGVSGERRVHLYLKKDPRFNTLRERFASYGLDPTWSNLWDLVPYSFVVDWFVDVGGFLETLSQNSRYTRLGIAYSIISEKVTRFGEIGGFELERVRYSRQVLETPPGVDYTFQSGPGVRDHWIEGTALILQRTPKKQ